MMKIIKTIFDLGGNFFVIGIAISEALKINQTLQKLDLGKLIYIIS